LLGLTAVLAVRLLVVTIEAGRRFGPTAQAHARELLARHEDPAPAINDVRADLAFSLIAVGVAAVVFGALAVLVVRPRRAWCTTTCWAAGLVGSVVLVGVGISYETTISVVGRLKPQWYLDLLGSTGALLLTVLTAATIPLGRETAGEFYRQSAQPPVDPRWAEFMSR
jgi:hypothetical protein